MKLLVVDDEQPARDELAFLLAGLPEVGEVVTCGGADEALRLLGDGGFDGALLDIRMPGLSGVELAGVLARFKEPPPVVFVTAHEEHAVEAFGVEAVDYVLKPVRPERLQAAIRRIEERTNRAPERGEHQVAVELGGVTRFVDRREVGWVEAQGDYVRLHVVGRPESHLLRTPLSSLAERWAPAGFAQIHRSLLVNLRHVSQLRTDAGRSSVVVDGEELQVSRRHTRALRDLLVGGERS